MNASQNKILLVAAATIALSGIFAPMHAVYFGGVGATASFDCGYRIINFPAGACAPFEVNNSLGSQTINRSERAEVNALELGLEWAGILLISGLLLAATKKD